jgi:hypothetical protein
MQLTKTPLLIILGLTLSGCNGSDTDSDPAQVIQEQEESPSVARQWNEVLLNAIRSDFARPTVHARNLFHISSAMYDAWAISNKDATPYLAGGNVNNYQCDVKGISATTDIKFQEEALSYAAYRLIDHRFFRSPGAVETQTNVTNLMTQLSFDTANSSTDYENGGAAELGNYIANCYIEFGLLDSSNEQYGYINQFYLNENGFIEPALQGNPNAIANNNYNSWQPISLSKSIDQSGNEVENTPPFLSPEWGNVLPFSMSEDSGVTKIRNGDEYKIYFDPGSPPLLGTESSEFYQWNFALVSIWSSHLDPKDGVMIDISPKTLGNNPALPSTNSLAAYQQFYVLNKGGDASQGYAENPITGQPYQEQRVPRGDYVRALAEFWADGPESETPPGHWFVIMNEVFEHPLFERKFAGSGDIIGPLEWDVKAYFALGAAMHDSAIAAWGIKGYYDYLRPVSAIRLMADLGQSSEPTEANYHPLGIPLSEGYIELVNSDDPLAGMQQEHMGKIKVKAWRGPDYIQDTSQDEAGVDWILAENWWPYQRPSFVSPPFSGFISGHSTYSRAAAELLTRLTGSAYFPGGMSEFTIAANEFLVFEKGPSVDLTLQWATYRDASDQCSLSRIWGGIHPPIDDIPGRKIGEIIGNKVFEKVTSYFKY